MCGRTIEGADARLRELRHEQQEELSLAPIALVLGLGATQFLPALALPLFLGGLAVGTLGLRALWRYWDLLDRLAGDRDAYVIPEVRAYASREATMERRQACAAIIRNRLQHAELATWKPTGRLLVELEALAELEDDGLALDPASAVACSRLLTDFAESSDLNPALPPEELSSRVCTIRSGFGSRRPPP